MLLAQKYHDVLYFTKIILTAHRKIQKREKNVTCAGTQTYNEFFFSHFRIQESLHVFWINFDRPGINHR